MPQPGRPQPLGWSPWRAVVGFGLVSLAADMVYEGARSITGPLLASLGASAVLVGVVTGAGEATALVLRLLTGSWADRSARYWSLTLGGYAMTAVCVPALALTPFLGPAGLATACSLVILERAGKAVRSPAKSTLLAYASGPVGLGRGFGVHKALDQIGAFAGPLLVAGVVALSGAIWPAMALLALPGVAAMFLLVRMRARVGEPDHAESAAAAGPAPAVSAVGLAGTVRDLPGTFWRFAAAAGLTTAGLVTFGVISYHLVRDDVMAVAAVPVVYAAAMAAAAVAALASGWLYDRWGARALLVLPFVVTAVPALAFSATWPPVLGGILLWGAATGIHDSTVKAIVADLVPAARRATGFGLFAAVQGAAALAGGALAGALYARSVPALVAVVAVLQGAALVLLVRTLREARSAAGPPPGRSQPPPARQFPPENRPGR